MFLIYGNKGSSCFICYNLRMVDSTLALKYRPKGLSDFIGNDVTKKLIYGFFDKSNPNHKGSIDKSIHNYFITGTTGCGKTTLTRILVGLYMCTGDTSGVMCGECNNCSASEEYILTGNTDGFMDCVIEYNASSLTGKDSLEELIQRIQVLPAIGFPYRIAFIDECHRMSQAAQDSMLKYVEDSPEHVIMIFSTNEPEKVLTTLKDRCQARIKVEKPTSKELLAHLMTVSQAENIKYDAAGLRMICSYSENVVRRSLNQLNTLASAGLTAKASDVAKVFNLYTDDILSRFMKSYLELNSPEFLGLVSRVSSSGDLDNFISNSIQFLVRGSYVRAGAAPEDMQVEEVRWFKNLFQDFEPSTVAQFLSVLTRAQKSPSAQVSLVSSFYEHVDTVSQRAKESQVEETLGRLQEMVQRLTESLQVRVPGKPGRFTSAVSSDLALESAVRQGNVARIQQEQMREGAQVLGDVSDCVLSVRELAERVGGFIVKP